LAAKCEALKLVQVPDLEDLLQSSSKRVLYKDRSQFHQHETILILQSSGTTGLPKPVHVKAGALAVVNSIKRMPAPEGRRNMHDELYAPKLMVSMMPFFHIMGITLLARSIYHQGPLVLLPARKPVTADLMMRAIDQTKPSAAACAPSILEDICNAPNGLETLSTLEYVFYGGAPLARPCGDKISSMTNLQVCIGSTEILNAPSYIPRDQEDWEYFEWSDESGVVMEATADNFFELVIKQKFNREYQTVFYNFPELSEWRTQDLFERHPTKPGLWRYTGRIDDMLVLSNGEKLNPVSFEKSVEGHPWVRGALIIGSGRFQAGLIIEPQTDQVLVDSEAFIEQVWPWIEKANAQYPAHARVWHSMITMAAPEKPFKRAPKGSVMRQASYQLYEAEIDELYAKQKLSDNFDDVEIDNRADIIMVKTLVRKAFRFTLHPYREDPADDADIFLLGVDSLQVLQLSNVLTRAFRKKPHCSDICPPRMIYKNPSIDRLSRAIMTALNNNDHLGKTSPESTISREEKISAMIYKYTKSLPKDNTNAAATQETRSLKHAVILTGSTGSLGTYLLHYLLSNPAFERIYCLNRSTDAASRQEQSFRDRGMSLVYITSKVEFLTTDFSQDLFGLPPAKYLELQQTVDVFIHNAWPINFNSDLEYFEATAVAGTRRCVDFAVSARYNPHIIFVSSIASVGNWSVVRDAGDGGDDGLEVPEVFEEDKCLPLKQGYGESKHVASCILATAARVSGVKTTIVRTGQLGGPVEGEGVWNKSGKYMDKQPPPSNRRSFDSDNELQLEWLPSLIATSKALHKIPRSLGSQNTLDWVPVDIAAHSILDITISRIGEDAASSKALDCFNIVNPQTADWRDLVHVILAFYQKRGGCDGSRIEPVEFTDWINELKNIEMTRGQIERYPGVKLIEFFEAMSNTEKKVKFATEHTVDCSRTMADLRAVDKGLMERWLEGWSF
jgi:nucleoside-diphosphate-sugar epimerase